MKITIYTKRGGSPAEDAEVVSWVGLTLPDTLKLGLDTHGEGDNDPASIEVDWLGAGIRDVTQHQDLNGVVRQTCVRYSQCKHHRSLLYDCTMQVRYQILKPKAVAQLPSETISSSRSLTMIIGTPPSHGRIPVEIRPSSTIAPIDIGRLSWKACPRHATLIEVD